MCVFINRAVNGKSFTDEKTIWDIPEVASFGITYLPSDPQIHSENPEKDLALYKEQLKKNPAWWRSGVFLLSAF
jgi:hypothetical protein